MANLVYAGRNWSEETERGLNVESELRVAVVQDPPYVWIHSMPDGSYRYEGYLYDVWETIAQSLNLHYRLIPLQGGGFGHLDVNGTWTGMVGELAYGRADLALTWLWMRRDRLEVVDYLDAVPVEEDINAFYIRKDMGNDLSLTADMFGSLLKPLHMNVWWALLGALLVLSLALKATARFSRAEDRRAASEETWAACLLSSFMAFMSQGWPSMPNSLAGRIVTIFAWILCIIIHTSYTANLISHLTVVTVNRPIKSLEEFSDQPDWMLGVMPGHIILNDWRASRDKYERELYQRVLNRDRVVFFDATENSARELIKPKVLTYFGLEQLFFLLGSEACSLIPLNDKPKKVTKSYIPIAKEQRKLQHKMNQILQKIREAGILAELKKRWFTEKHVCVSRRGVEPMSLGDSLPLLMIMPMGFAVSCVIFALEWMLMSRVARRNIGENSTVDRSC